MKNRAITFLFIAGISSAGLAIGATCTGIAANSCGNTGATQSTCSNYYLSNGTNSIQCKWIGTGTSAVCSDGGARCTAALSEPHCTGIAATSCSKPDATSSSCSNYYLNSGSNSTQCHWNGSNCSNGGTKCNA